MYNNDHTGASPRWLQLGSTGIFANPTGWNDESSPYDTSNPRAIAEDELLHGNNAVVLNLSGLYGGERQPRNWVTRVAKTKEQVKEKGAVHLVHGRDVARAIVLCWEKWGVVEGKRWIVTDLWSYDWWGLFMMWGAEARKTVQATEGGRDGELLYEQWVAELMVEQGVRALPREKEKLGRLVDGRGFWKVVGSVPEIGRVV